MKRRMQKNGDGLHAPRFNCNIERENNVAQTRIEKGFTQKQLSKIIGISECTMVSIEAGLVNLFRIVSGGGSALKDWVFMLSEALNTSVSDLFPREVCDIAKNDITYEQFKDIFFNGEIWNSDRIFLRRHIEEALKTLTIREETIVRDHIFEDKTFTEIAVEQNRSMQCILQHYSTALRKLRHPDITKYLRDFY